jgi:hypothetical protein
MFWGEQPPFTSIGRGGRYFFRVTTKTSRFKAQARTSRFRASGRISWPAALILVVLITALLAGFAFWRLETWPGRSAHEGTAELERLGKDLRNAFVDVAHLQPRVTINNRVYLEQTTSTTELTVLSRQVEVEHELQHTWAGSSKHVKLHGTFAVKAGFDLRQNLSVDVRPDVITVQLPHAQILGVEQEKLDVLALENGFWNRISSSDLETELAVLPKLAREKATDAGLTRQAEASFQEQLAARIHAPQRMQIVFGGAELKKD